MNNYCLCIDTTHTHIVVGLFSKQNQYQIVRKAPREAFQNLFPAIQEVLSAANVKRPSEIVTLTGPGSFTGIRICVSAARDLAQLWNVPVRGIGTLTCYSLPIRNMEPGPFAVCIDGKQNRFYTKIIPESGLSATQMDLIPVQDLTAEEVAASGLPVYCDDPDTFRARNGGDSRQLKEPEAAWIFAAHSEMSASGSYQELFPYYLRKDPAEARYPGGFNIK